MQRRITEWILGINYYGALSLESFNSAIMKSFSATSNFSEAFVSRLRTADSLYQQLHDEAWLQVVLQVFKKILFPTIRAEDFLQLLVLMKQLLIWRMLFQKRYLRKLTVARRKRIHPMFSLQSKVAFSNGQQSIMISWIQQIMLLSRHSCN